MKIAIGLLLASTALAASTPAPPASAVFDVRAFGARGDGRTLDSDAINRAITAAAATGGGEVLLPAGDYLSYSVRLRSHITLHLAAGATLIAADPPAPGQPGGYDAPEPNQWSQYQDFAHSHWHNSLIWGENLDGVSIVGPGRIFGRGLSRGNGRISQPVGAPPPPPVDGLPADVLEADGPVTFPPRPDLVPGPFGYPNARDTLPDGVGNKAIALKNSRNLILRDFSILHGGHFGVLVTGVSNVTVDNLVIDTNRDGIDVDASSNVRISNTSVNSPWDDGICLKASHALGEARATENVTIMNAFVSGFDEGTLLDGTRKRTWKTRGGPHGRIKLGTEAGGGFRNIAISNSVFEHSRGLALEQVDGGVMEDIVVSNITMREVQNAPIFIRLGARLRRPGVTEPGSARRILIDNVTGWDVSPDHGILIAGLPGHPIEDLTLSNLQFHYAGGGTAAQAARVVPEMERGYPDPYHFGVIPSWGIFARHVKNLRIRGVDLHTAAPDARPAAVLEDVTGGRLSDIELFGGGSAWSLKDVADLRVRDVTGLANDRERPAESFACTEVVGLMTTGEWYKEGFEEALGAEAAAKWQGRFAHYGYVMEYAKPDSYAWSPIALGGVNSVSLTRPCANGAAPDRIIYQAWSWELTTQDAWVSHLEAALATIRAKRPSARRIELMTIVRAPGNQWCHADKPPLGPNTDHDATRQDAHVPAYVDAAFAQVAARYPGLISVAPKFEAHACAPKIDGIHLGPAQNRAVAGDIADHYKQVP